MRILLIIPCGHSAKLFEAAKEALNGVLLGVAGCVVSPRVTTLAPGRHHGANAVVSECGHQWGGITGSVGHHERWGQALKQGQGLWRLMALPGCEAATPRSTAGLGGHMQICGQAPTAATQGLRPIFLRAPLACWCARTVVESTKSVRSAGPSCTASHPRCQIPEAAQRWKYVYVVCHLPRSLGRARHRAPLRASHKTTPTNFRLSRSCPQPTRADSPGQ